MLKDFRLNSHKIVIFGAIITALMTLTFRLHGFSLPTWNERFDLPPATSILYGHAKAIRSDDWAVELPVILGQSQHPDFFPRFNNKFEMDMLINTIKIPVAHPFQLFRPAFWGFFFGGDFGLSWLWVFLNAGLFLGLYNLFNFINGGNVFLAAAAAIFFTIAPLAQYWSLHFFDIVVHGSFATFFFLKLLSEKKAHLKWLYGVLFGWMAAAFILNPYPPFQILSGYFFLAILVGYFFSKRSEVVMQLRQKNLILPFSVGIVIIAIAVSSFLYLGRDVLPVIQNTIYPGARMETGGDFPFWRFFAHSFAPIHKLVSGQEFNWSKLGNECEAAQVVFILPFFMLTSFLRKDFPDRNNNTSLLIAIFSLFVIIYAIFGLPETLARATLFSKVTTTRTVLGVGLATAYYLATANSNVKVFSKKNVKSIAPAIVIFCLLSFYFVSAARWSTAEFSALTANLTVLIGTLIAMMLIFKPKLGAGALALYSCYGLSYNPVVTGNYQSLLNSNLANLMKEEDLKLGGNSKWAIFGDFPDTNLPRLIGLNTLNGTMLYPKFDTWRFFDPEKKNFEIYNRFAHFTLKPTDESNLKMSLFAIESIDVSINPKDKIFADSGTTHFLVRHEYAPYFQNSEAFCPLGKFNTYEVFSRGKCSMIK